MKIVTIFGTRPEAIKLAPVINELNNRGLKGVNVSTGQHQEMLKQVTDIFGIKSDYSLDIMSEKQTLADITTKALSGITKVLKAENPDVVIVQGDTTSAFAGGLAAFYQKIPVAHVEAGLRTWDKYNPFPEEINRKLISCIADYNFCPTEGSKKNLLEEGIAENSIFVTGNTVVDALLSVSAKNIPYENKALDKIDFSKKVILLTSHRRENLDNGMEDIFSSINEITKIDENVNVIFPIHLNPAVRQLAKSILGDNKKVVIIEPLSYTDLVNVMKKCYMVMTDSGGIQEEAPAFGKPVLVLRRTTERPEGISAGTAKLVGTDKDNIVSEAKKLLLDKSAYKKMAHSINPYGDGKASSRIIDVLEHSL
jgi:UDP-N-acetylglucosamine 2-epimerase (non-hydrolysing)